MQPLGVRFRIALSCLLFFYAVPGSAQSPIIANVLNPTGFLAPGQSVDILVKIANPQDSGITITGIDGFNFWSGLEISGELDGSEVFPLYPNPLQCGSERQCLSSGSFPLLPGDSAVVAVKAIRANATVSIGKALTLEYMQLRLQTDEQFRPEDILLGGMAVYIVSQDGSGDAAVFNQFAVQGDVQPLQEPNLSIRFDYPDTIPAGSHFNVTATVVNLGSQPVSRVSPSFFIFPLGGDQPQVPEGSHVNSYHVVRCTANCMIRGKLPLQPGASLEFDIANFYYQSETLFSGDFRTLLPEFTTSDFYFRSTFVDSDPVGLISVTSPRPGMIPNPQDLLPSRQPIELIESDSELAPDIVFDPNTGYEWLRIAETVGKSLPEVLAQTGQGGRYERFELASSSQVDTLLLNQLHASGIPAAAFSLAESNTEVNNALYWMIDALGEARSPFTFIFSGGSVKRTAGLVRDSAVFNDTVEGATFLEISANDPEGTNFSSPRGRRLQALGIPFDLSVPNNEPGWGYWMVRTSSVPEYFNVNKARFIDGELILPVVDLGSERVAARLRFDNELTTILRVISSSPPHTDFDGAVFDSNNGKLNVPEVDVHLGGGVTDVYRLVLRFLEESQLPIFELVEAEFIKHCTDEIIENPTETPGLGSFSIIRRCEPE